MKAGGHGSPYRTKALALNVIDFIIRDHFSDHAIWKINLQIF